jgi:glucose 1-dehydrogenase
MKGLAGKKVLVTGGSSGIGQAIAIRFGQEGCHVAIHYRRGAAEAEKTHALIHTFLEPMSQAEARHILVQADVSKEDDILRMFEAVHRELGGLDILINNAGFQISASTHESTTRDFDAVLGTNLRGAYLCAREALRHFVDQGKPGVIINISSVHQIIPKPKYIGYSVSKGGMQNLTTTLALEYADRGIRVNGVGPGATITPINRAWVDDPVKRAQVESHIPMRRAGTSEEMAAVVAFLASDEAAYITGQTLFVDGGLTVYADFATPWSSE